MAAAQRNADALASYIQNATDAYYTVLRETVPWQGDRIETVNSVVSAIDAYSAAYGKPGEPRYEAMIDGILQETRQLHLTPEQKRQNRLRRAMERDQKTKAANAAVGAKDG